MPIRFSRISYIKLLYVEVGRRGEWRFSFNKYFATLFRDNILMARGKSLYCAERNFILWKDEKSNSELEVEQFVCIFEKYRAKYHLIGKIRNTFQRDVLKVSSKFEHRCTKWNINCTTNVIIIMIITFIRDFYFVKFNTST